MSLGITDPGSSPGGNSLSQILLEIPNQSHSGNVRLSPSKMTRHLGPSQFGTIGGSLSLGTIGSLASGAVRRPHSEAIFPLSSFPVANAFVPSKPGSAAWLAEIISFYSTQADEVFNHLRAAIDEFLHSNFTSVRFVGHARAVVLAAHKLVYIADALSRATSQFFDDVAESGNALCDTLKTTVAAMKFAALAPRDVSAAGRVEECIMVVTCDSATLVDVIHAKRGHFFYTKT